jgi:tRNA nucleotidyltransferase (CCA-adding enzyme)
MARRAHAYPQVDPGAVALVDTPVVVMPASTRAGEALQLARRREAAVVQIGGALVLREDLARAAAMELGELDARDLARPLPVVDAQASEIAVRRRLAAGARAVVVARRGGTSGAVIARPGGVAAVSLGPRFARRLPPALEPLLETVRRVAAGLQARVFLAGGVVREALRDGAAAEARDIDLVVEGDGLRLARALADACASPAAALVEHERFLTATLPLPAQGHLDVATARCERYERPGALPHVLPATIDQDLGRRDFSVNAMAVELAGGGFELLDPFDGRGALARRRLTVLHPLSFVEDPTRVFRAARYAARLDFGLDAWSARALALALRLAPYPALSGARLLGELAHVAAEPDAGAALLRLGRSGSLRLIEPRYRFDHATAARVREVPAALRWSRAHDLAVEPVELLLVAVTAAQPPAVADAGLARLGLRGAPLDRIVRARHAVAPATGGERPSARAARWRARDDLTLAWLWLAGPADVRDELTWFVGQARGVRPALDGDDVARLGVPRGPQIARALTALRDARLDGRVSGEGDEERFVRAFIEPREEG